MTQERNNHELIQKQKLIENTNQELFDALNTAAYCSAKLDELHPSEKTAEMLANINRLIQLLTIL